MPWPVGRLTCTCSGQYASQNRPKNGGKLMDFETDQFDHYVPFAGVGTMSEIRMSRWALNQATVSFTILYLQSERDQSSAGMNIHSRQYLTRTRRRLSDRRACPRGMSYRSQSPCTAVV